MIIALEVQHLLEELGYRSFDIADSPQDALDQATRRRPDLITADVRILRGTGIEAVRAITAQLGEIPYFYVTGNRDMLADEQAPAIVEKPINHHQFAQACLRVAGTS